jgi:DNA-binding XRE family transcriptional regulator
LLVLLKQLQKMNFMGPQDARCPSSRGLILAMDTNGMDLGLRLKIERIRKRLRQRDVAIWADLSPSTVSDIEGGWKAPTPEQVVAICRALGVEPKDLEDHS